MDGQGLDPGRAPHYVQPRTAWDLTGATRTLLYPVPPPSPLPLPSKPATESDGTKTLKRPSELAETAAGLSQLSQTTIPVTPLAGVAPRLPAAVDEVSSHVSDREVEHTDKRYKTIRKSFSAEEERQYSQLFDHFLRNEEKVITINELTAHLEGKIPARFSETEKKNFIRSTYYNLAVQFSRIHKLQLRLLLQDTESQRWLEEPSLMIHVPEEARRRETERRIQELSRDLATRTMSASCVYIRPSEQEVARARALILKWLNPQLRPILLSKHEQPKKRRKGDHKKAEAGSPPLAPQEPLGS